MAIQIRLIKSQIVEFKSNVDMDDTVLTEILRRIKRLYSSPNSPGELHSIIEEIVKDPIEDFKNLEKMTVERFHDDSGIIHICVYDQERLSQSFETKGPQGTITSYATPLPEEVSNQINALSFTNPDSADLSVSESCDQGSKDSHMERVLESFNGYVEQIEDETAYVRLKSREHGDVLYGEYPAAKLAKLGIEEQDRFLCETVELDGKTRVELRKIPDKEVSDEELKAIQESIVGGKRHAFGDSSGKCDEATPTENEQGGSSVVENKPMFPPNQAALSILKTVRERQKGRRETDPSRTDELIREARAGELHGYGPSK